MRVRVHRAKKLFLSGENHMVSPVETDFDVVEQALRSVGALGEAAEIHGEFCGQACLMGSDAVPPWISNVLADAHSSEADRVLESLAAQTWKMLEEGDMSFTPLLPSDEMPLESRADNLGLWCQGFVHGLGVAGAQGDGNPVFEESPARDIIEDFSQIARAAFAESESGDEAETAYIELVEYVRVSVQLIFEEFYSLRASPAGRGTH
jgi:uncharacterized protein YgfB (UPF0149 family)